MLSESARMTTAQEASFRVPYPNSKPRNVKVVALDPASAEIVNEVAQYEWHGAAFFTSLSFTPKGSPGGAEGPSMQAWLEDLAGRTLDLMSEVGASDFVVVVTTAGSDARSVSVIADACNHFHKSLVGLVVPRPGTSENDVTTSLRHLRPFTRMLVVSNGSDYIEAMLTALRA
jgi:hypothetical protein